MKRDEAKKLNKYDFPVSRIGNTFNPKLVILLENQASHPEILTLNPEYTMYLDGKFKPSINSPEKNKENMQFETVIKYDKWWHDLSKIWIQSTISLQSDEILAIEYYPYATSSHIDKNVRQREKENEIYFKKWEDKNDLSIDLLQKNLRILNSVIENDVPIFVYYKAGWYSTSKNIDMSPMLKYGRGKFISHYEATKAVPNCIKERFKKFLEEEQIQTRIIELRNDLNYRLNIY